jgi:acyl carrier protein
MISEAKVRQVIALLLDAEEEELAGERLLSEIEGWDSVNAMRVLVYLERESGGAVDYERFMAAKRVGDLSHVLAASSSLGAVP